MTLLYSLVVLHIIMAAAYFGLGLTLTRQARLVASGEGGPAMDGLGRKTISLMTVFGGLTLVFAVSALLVGGGFGAYSTQFHHSLTLLLIILAVHFFLVRPGWNQLATDPAKGKKKVAAGMGVAHLLWLVILVLMFLHRLVPGVTLMQGA